MVTPIKATKDKVNVDLDSLTRDDAPEDFFVVIGGRRIQMTDPNDLDWLDTADIEHPLELLKLIFTPEDRKHISGLKIPNYKMNKLVEMYMEHFDLHISSTGKVSRF